MTHLSTTLPYFRPYRTATAVGLGLVVVSNLFTVMGPRLMQMAIDSVAQPGADRGTLLRYALLIAGAAVLGSVARYGMRELLNGVSRRVECDLRADFFRHLMRLDASFFERERTGDIMSRATHDTLAVRQAIGPAVMYAANTVTMTVLTLSLMLWISPRLTAFALIPMVFLPPVVLGFGRVIHRRFETIQEQFATLSTGVQEALTGVRVVRAYVQEADQARRFRDMNREYMRRNLDLAKVEGFFHPALGLLMALAMTFLLAFGGAEVIAGTITIGELVAFFFYVGLLAWPMIALGWVVNLFQRGEASMGRINSVLETRPLVVPGRGRALAHPSGRIEFRDVSFRYPGSERLVLQDLSFVVEPGETIALVGSTGSGKSSLVSLIPRVYDPVAGEILLDGVPLPEYDPVELRRHIGVVPQDAFLFSETIAANVGLGLDPRTDEDDPASEDPPPDDAPIDERVLRATEMARLHEQVQGFPNQYGTYLGERGINLSGGQKQRATLARALAKDPTVLIMDDALSAVDTETEAEILASLRGALKGRTSFLISHRATAVMTADRILVLDQGRIVEEGTHSELVARGGVYAGLLRRQLLERDLEDARIRFARTGSPA